MSKKIITFTVVLIILYFCFHNWFQISIKELIPRILSLMISLILTVFFFLLFFYIISKNLTTKDSVKNIDKRTKEYNN